MAITRAQLFVEDFVHGSPGYFPDQSIGDARLQDMGQVVVYLDTHEAFTMDGRSSKLFADVRRLRKKGATPAQIAKQLHYFKHTIKAVDRWLKDGHFPINC